LITLPEPDWLDEAYSNPIARGDVGLLRRCQMLAKFTRIVVRTEGLRHGRFLDWAGGYGLLTGLLRDAGLDFNHWDPYCKNLFAVGREGKLDDNYDLVTAYEVLEHLPRPAEALADVANCSDLLLFTTVLLPDPPPSPGEWWYFAAESGQHVTFYTRQSLELLGRRLGYQLLSNGQQLHLFHRARVNPLTRIALSNAVLTLKTAVRSLRLSVGGQQRAAQNRQSQLGRDRQ